MQGFDFTVFRLRMLSLSLLECCSILLLILASSPSAAHLIEVAASKKECFFEDLHKNDQVQIIITRTRSVLNAAIIDDSYIPSWRWWAS